MFFDLRLEIFEILLIIDITKKILFEDEFIFREFRLILSCYKTQFFFNTFSKYKIIILIAV